MSNWNPARKGHKLPEKTRNEVLERDNFRCQARCSPKCSVTTELQIGHIVPWAQGGSDSLSNLRVECKSCNLHLNGKVQAERLHKYSAKRPKGKHPGLV